MLNRQIFCAAALLLALPVFSFAAESTLRTDFISLTVQVFQTVARESVSNGDEKGLAVYAATLGRSPIVDYAMYVSSTGVVRAASRPDRVGTAVTDSVGKNAMANRDPAGLRVVDEKNAKGETVFDASLPVIVGGSEAYAGYVRIGFKNLR